MSLLADVRLTDPTAAAVRDALRRACVAANGKRKTGVLVLTDSWAGTLAKRVTGDPDGFHNATGTHSTADTTRLTLAWWTAPGGRKLARVRAWREPFRAVMAADEQRVRQQNEMYTRPRAWLLDPERMTLVEADGTAACVAVCGCGAAGSPESLAWAGGMCGPCRDRIEEEGPDAVAHPPALLTADGFKPWDAGFSPDGAVVAAMGREGYRIWDARTGALRGSGAKGEYNSRTTSPVVGPGGLFAYHNDNDHSLRWLDASAAKPKEAIVRLGQAYRAGFWTGRPGELLVQEYSDSRIRLLTLRDGNLGKPVVASNARLLAVHPDPKTPQAVFAESGRAAVRRVGPKGELKTEHEFSLGVGPRNLTGHWTNGPRLARFTADGQRLLFVAAKPNVDYPSELPSGDYLELWNPARPKALLQVTFPVAVADAQFSPDGERLYVLGGDGSVFVCHPGLLTHVRARLRWHVGPAHSLAVSPDGRTLATAGTEGVKLWPVGRLLEVL